MARIRSIKPQFWKHPVMAKLPDDFQLLALALLSMADDEGYFRADASVVRGEVMPFRENLARIREGLEKLSEVRWIELSDHSEQGMIGRITKWTDHQRVDHPKESNIKGYFTREVIANHSRNIPEPFALEKGVRSKEKEEEKGVGDQSETVSRIWHLYPSNKHRKNELLLPRYDSEAILSALARDGIDIVTRGVTAYLKATNTWPASERKFIRPLDKWFNSSDYLKDPAEWQTKNPTQPTGVVYPNALKEKERLMKEWREAIGE